MLIVFFNGTLCESDNPLKQLEFQTYINLKVKYGKGAFNRVD